MRLVRYEDAVDGTAIDLHPRISVLAGLSSGVRGRLIAALSALPSGSDPGAKGSLEVHGVLLDLAQASLELVELRHDHNVVVTRHQLPEPPDFAIAPVPARSIPAANGEILHGLGQQVAAAEARWNAAEARRVELSTAHDALRRERSLRGELPDLSGANEAAQRLAEAESYLDALCQARLNAAGSASQERRAELHGALVRAVEEVADLRHQLHNLAANDIADIRAAALSLKHSLEPELVPSAQGAALAMEIEQVDSQIAVLEAQDAGDQTHRRMLQERLDAARAELAAAEASFTPRSMDRALVDELEAVHDEIFELDGRTSKLSNARVRRRMSELHEREAQLLNQLGFDTWASYVMGPSGEDHGAMHHRVDAAARSVADAERALAEVAATPSAAHSQLVELREHRAALGTRATELLGPLPDEGSVVERLRTLRVPAEVVDPMADVLRTHSALAHRGVQAPTIPGALLDFTLAWIEQHDSEMLAETRRLEIGGERMVEAVDIINRELAAMDEEEAAANVAMPSDDDVVAAMRQVEELRALVEQYQEAERDAALLRARLRAEEVEEAELTVAVSDAEAAVAEATSALELARARYAAEAEAAAVVSVAQTELPSAQALARGRLEWAVLSHLSPVRSVSFVGSLPVVFDDAFRDWPFAELAGTVETLVRLSEIVQIIILTDDVEWQNWARQLGTTYAQASNFTR